ncbi:MAG: hypothetical protein ACSHX4_12015 [Opitutaceae bacterium]
MITSALKYLILITTIICSAAFILNYSKEAKRITQIRDNLHGFAVEAAKLPFSSDWKEIIQEDEYPYLDYTKLEFIPVLKESLPLGKPFIVYRDVDRTYEVWLDGHVDIRKTAP